MNEGPLNFEFKRPLTSNSLKSPSAGAARSGVLPRPAHGTARACCAPAAQTCCALPRALCPARTWPASLSSLRRTRKRTAFARRPCRASPCTGQGCSYVLRQRPREGALCHRSRLPRPPTTSPAHISFAPPPCDPNGPASRDTRTRSSPRPRPCPHRVNRGIVPHCSRICPPSSRPAHCVYRLLCLLVGTIINLSPSSTSPLWCACPEPHTCSPRHLLPTTRAHAHCVTREG